MTQDVTQQLTHDILHCDTSGASISFIDPVLEQLLQELSELRNLLDRHDNLHLTGNPLMVFSGSVTSVNYVSPFYEQYGQYAPMLLSLDETREPVLQSHITVLLVNPYSKNIELAKAWLSWLAANPTDRTRCVLITGMPDGIETERSRIMFAEYEEREAVLQQKYNEALASGDPNVIEEAQDALYSNIMPIHNWNVTPEHARMLYPTLPFAHVIHYNPYTILLTNGEQVIQEYLYGKRTAHELLQALQSLAVMINAEGS